jgi:mannose-6-phosphate isomerase-like protein (cupin superfamily)
MIAKFRRVVTGVNEKGESIIQFDGEAGNVFLFPTLPGAAVTELWVTNDIPVDNTGTEDRGARPFKHDPDPNGTIFRIVELPPEKKLSSPESAEAAMGAAMDAMGSRHKATAEDRSKHPTMHMTDSVDYLIVLSGELTMIMDVGEVTLKPFDCIVQRGTRHAWANRGNVPVLLAAALVEAKHIEGH